MPDSQSGGSEPIITTGKRKRGPADLITVIVALVIIGVVAANVLKNTGEEQTSTDVEDTTSEEQQTQNPEETEPTPDIGDIVMTYMTGSEFQEKTRAESTINGSQGKTPGSQDYEYIVSGVVQDETNPDLVYFATQSNKPLGNFVGVYQFNTKTLQWQRFYKNSFLPEDKLGPKELRVIGKDGRDLIVLVDRLDRDEEDCDSFWLIGTKAPYELMSLNLDKPLDGLASYTIPSAVRLSEQDRVEDCLAK
jgi:hypothetical protein